MLGLPELLIIGFFVFVPIIAVIVVVFAVVDAAGRTESEFQSIGQKKMLWIVLPIVLTVLTGMGGLIAGLIYLISIKPKLVAVTASVAH